MLQCDLHTPLPSKPPLQKTKIQPNQELARRTDTLIRLIEKENEEDEERNAASRKGKSGGAGGRKRANSVTAASSADVGGDEGKTGGEIASARKSTRATAASPAK